MHESARNALIGVTVGVTGPYARPRRLQLPNPAVEDLVARVSKLPVKIQLDVANELGLRALRCLSTASIAVHHVWTRLSPRERVVPFECQELVPAHPGPHALEFVLDGLEELGSALFRCVADTWLVPLLSDGQRYVYGDSSWTEDGVWHLSERVRWRPCPHLALSDFIRRVGWAFDRLLGVDDFADIPSDALRAGDEVSFVHVSSSIRADLRDSRTRAVDRIDSFGGLERFLHATYGSTYQGVAELARVHDREHPAVSFASGELQLEVCAISYIGDLDSEQRRVIDVALRLGPGEHPRQSFSARGIPNTPPYRAAIRRLAELGFLVLKTSTDRSRVLAATLVKVPTDVPRTVSIAPGFRRR